MKSFIIPAALALSVYASADAFAGRALTLYLDGGQVEQRASARNGYLEMHIPPAAVKDSLRIAPAQGVEILRVETIAQKPVKSVERQLGQLTEREEQLNDRLKALTVREEIFKSAAKSQSAKAPRRTKTNPEPLATIRQGTDFAITQLETVYHARRKVEKELAQIAERRARLGREELSGGTVARVWLTPASGSVIASWSQSDKFWSPSYQVRVDEKGGALVSLSAHGVALAKGETADLVLAPLQTPGAAARFRYESERVLLKTVALKVADSQEMIAAPFSVSLINSSALDLPSGEISCFKRGIYMGRGSFKGAAVGKTIEIVCGSR